MKCAEVALHSLEVNLNSSSERSSKIPKCTKSPVGRSLNKDPRPRHGGPQIAETREKSQSSEWVSDLGFYYIPFFLSFFFSTPRTLTLCLAGRAGVFWNENTGIVAALKHHHHPLKYSANSYFGQGGGEACLCASGKNTVQKIPGQTGKGLASSHLNPVA